MSKNQNQLIVDSNKAAALTIDIEARLSIELCRFYNVPRWAVNDAGIDNTLTLLRLAIDARRATAALLESVDRQYNAMAEVDSQSTWLAAPTT